MCWKCGKKLDFFSPVSRSALCPVCGADVRCCRNCTFYEAGAHYDCRETIEEPVCDKERSCFCDFFSLNPEVFPSVSSGGAFFRSSVETSNGGAFSASINAKNAFNALFGD